MSSVYDPFGLLSPYILRAEMFFQLLLSELPQLPNFSIPRCIKQKHFMPSTAQLHHFSDVSESAYGALTYIRFLNDHGDVHISLIASKARLAPMKSTSISGLELAAALEAVKLAPRGTRY